MKIMMVALALLLGSLPLPVAADDKSDVEAATARWIDAFNRKSLVDILALYAPDAVFFGTTSPVLRDTPELVRGYFTGLPVQADAVMSMGEHRVQVFGSVAINTGYYTRTAMQDGREVKSPARFSFVYQKRGGRWLIVNHHSSAFPQQ